MLWTQGMASLVPSLPVLGVALVEDLDYVSQPAIRSPQATECKRLLLQRRMLHALCMLLLQRTARCA